MRLHKDVLRGGGGGDFLRRAALILHWGVSILLSGLHSDLSKKVEFRSLGLRRIALLKAMGRMGRSL